jgi:hypothetical protein
MNNLQKRYLLFLIGCIGSRTAIAYIAKTINLTYLPLLGALAILPVIGWIYIIMTSSRKTGPEVFGDKIWWGNLRPIHALLYALFAYYAINKNRNAWQFLAADVVLGLMAFLWHHFG